MKFEKLSENKLKITLKSSELPNIDSDKVYFQDGDLDSFMANSDNARRSFIYLLDLANKEVGFDASNFKIKIEAKSLYNGNYTFLVTKLVNLKDDAVKPKKKKISSVKPRKVILPKEKEYVDYTIYRFDKLDDFYYFRTFVENHEIDIDKISTRMQLYEYNNSYFLSIENIDSDYVKAPLFISEITEFSEFYSGSLVFEKVLSEHAKKLVTF